MEYSLPFLDHNRSLYNFKPSYCLNSLRASWLVWYRFRFYQLNKSRSEKQLTALHVLRTFHHFNRYVFILLTKMRTGTKTVPSTIFSTFRGTHTDFSIRALCCYWLSTWGTTEFINRLGMKYYLVINYTLPSTWLKSTQAEIQNDGGSRSLAISLKTRSRLSHR